MDKCVKAPCDWKYSTLSTQTVLKWHGGNVCVHHSEKFCWHLDFYENFSASRAAHSIKLAGEVKKLVIQKERILLIHSSGTCSIKFKSESDKVKIAEVLKPLEAGSCVLHAGLKCLANRTNPVNGSRHSDATGKSSHTPGYNRMTPVKENRMPTQSSSSLVKTPTSAHHFTRVKDHDLSPLDELTENTAPVDANLHGSGDSTQKIKFLECSKAKANKSLTTNDFYGSKSGSAQLNGAFGVSGIKRKPGFLSLNENENKRPRTVSGLLTSSRKQITLDEMAVVKQTATSLLGFSNLGNTCYMNSILQALFCLVPFSSDLQRVVRRRFPSGPGGVLCRTMASLLQTPLKIDTSSDREHLLTKIKDLIATTAKCFNGHEQHDAHEFLNRMLDQLKEEVNGVTTVTDNQNGSPSQNGSPLQNSSDENNCNPITQNFEGEMRQTITCTNCKQDSYKNVIINDISLVVNPGNKRISVQDRIHDYFKPNIIEYNCTNCKSNQALLTDKFLRLPRIVILLLKRYQCDSSSNRKIAENIVIPRYITFKEHCNQDTCPPTKMGASPYEGNNILWMSHQPKPLHRMRFKERFLDNSKEDQKISDADMSQAHLPTETIQVPLPTDVAEELLLPANVNQETIGSAQKSTDSPTSATKANSKYYDEEDLRKMSDEDQLEAALNLSRGEVPLNDLSSEKSPKFNCIPVGEPLSTDRLAQPCNDTTQTSPDQQQHSATPFGSKGSSWSKPLTPDRPSALSARALKRRISKELFPADSELKPEEGPLSLPDAFDTTEDKENVLPSYIDLVPDKEQGQPIIAEATRTQTEEEFDADLRRAIELSLQTQFPQTDEEAENLQHTGNSEAAEDEDDDSLLVAASEMAELEELKQTAETGELPYSYSLMSVVNHFGSNASLGHYVADVYDINTDQWYTCDDSHISFTTEEAVLTTRKKTGYILFYLSKDLEDEIKEYRRTATLHC